MKKKPLNKCFFCNLCVIITLKVEIRQKVFHVLNLPFSVQQFAGMTLLGPQM